MLLLSLSSRASLVCHATMLAVAGQPAVRWVGASEDDMEIARQFGGGRTLHTWAT